MSDRISTRSSTRCSATTWAVALTAGFLVAACVPDPPGDGYFWREPDGGSVISPTGGRAGGTGGATATGGTTDPGTGGATSTGGLSSTGGRDATGGIVGTGGNAGTTGGTFGNTGGSMATGGAVGTGGRFGTGGAGPATGGFMATGGMMATGGSGNPATGGSSGALTGSLKITVTTKAAGGRYQPDNVGAIWIADANTKFIKSLLVWGSQRRREIRNWVSATTAAGMASSVVDAVTAATYKSHGTRTATWNGTDTMKAAVPDGSYKVCFELEDGSSAYQCVDFMKSRTAQSLKPGDNSSFTQRTIEYTP